MPKQKSGQLHKTDRVRFVYEKARHHRTFHADGAWAGTSPQGEIQFAFFNDLRPMPEHVTHAVQSDGTLGEELSRNHDAQNVVREANVTVVMSKERTRQLIELLSRMVEQLEQLETKPQAEPLEEISEGQELKAVNKIWTPLLPAKS